MNVTKVACDYLVIGAGAASMAFIDTLLTEHPTKKIILIDKNPAPGGHWLHAYGFVRLHQPSLLYGMASRQLEGSWLKLMVGRWTLPWNHRASKQEILEHYHAFIQDKIAAGQIEYFPNCQYEFESKDSNSEEENEKTHSFSSLDGTKHYSVQVDIKVVNGTMGECIIPSQSPVSFPVDPNIDLITPNQVFDGHLDQTLHYKGKHFVVLGCGKTAMDTIVYLQCSMKVDYQDISWVIPNDAWMLLREGGGNPWSWPAALLEHGGNERDASLALEEKGIFARLDKNVEPTRFRFPVVGKNELKYMRRIRNLIRRGRVTSIRQGNDEKVIVKFGDDQPSWIPDVDRQDLIFVHCTSPGPFNGKKETTLFVNDYHMNLDLLFAPPVPISMSVLAYLESARINGKLDLDFGRKLLRALDDDDDTAAATREQARPVISDNEVLKRLVTGMPLKPPKGKLAAQGPFQSLTNLAVFLALSNNDPMVSYHWMGGNRLSFLSIPGFKCGVYENLGLLSDNAAELGYTKADTRTFELLRDKLQILKGR